MPKRSRTMRGGFFESLSNWGNSMSQGASDLWNKTKKSTTNTYNSSMNSGSTYGSPTKMYGGRSRKMRGGVAARAATVNSAYGNINSGYSYGAPRGGARSRRMRGGLFGRAAAVANSNYNSSGYGYRRGGSSTVNARTPLNNIASHAAPVSNVKTAQPHNWVGGKRRRHRGGLRGAVAANASYNNGSYGVRRGGYHARTPLHNIASNAAPFDVAPSAKPHR